MGPVTELRLGNSKWPPFAFRLVDELAVATIDVSPLRVTLDVPPAVIVPPAILVAPLATKVEAPLTLKLPLFLTCIPLVTVELPEEYHATRRSPPCRVRLLIDVVPPL